MSKEIIIGEGTNKAKPRPRPKLAKLKRARYEELMYPLRIELLKVQDWVSKENLKFAAIYEGRDAGGKGGTLKRFIEFLNPRGVRVVALDKPTDRERTQWYMQRYVQHLPAGGEMVFFDRSWYNRAVVERVMGFCTIDETKEFLRSVTGYEEMLVNSGIKLFKLWFSVSKEEQLTRFNRRQGNPLKMWKLSPVDKESQGQWDVYSEAKEDMLYFTSTDHAPWTIVKSDDKKRARVNAIRFVLSQLDYPGKDESLCDYDKNIIRTVDEDIDFS